MQQTADSSLLVLPRKCRPGCVLEQPLQHPSLRADHRCNTLVDVLLTAETELVMRARPLPNVALHICTLLRAVKQVGDTLTAYNKCSAGADTPRLHRRFSCAAVELEGKQHSAAAGKFALAASGGSPAALR